MRTYEKIDTVFNRDIVTMVLLVVTAVSWSVVGYCE